MPRNMLPDNNPTIKTQDNLLKGILFLLGFCAVAPIMDAFAKQLTIDFPIMQIVWARFFMHMILAVPFVLVLDRKAFFHPQKIKTQIARSVMLMFATTFFFTGLKYMPMASNLALAFIAPFILTGLSAFILKEKVGIRRWSAVIIGFIGVLIMLQPGAGLFTIYAIFPMACGVVYAIYILLTRKVAGADPPFVTLAYTSVTAALLMSLYLIISGDWITPTSFEHWGFMLAIGCWAMVSHFCLIRAFDYASASALSPYLYAEIIMATILGYLWFGEFPDFTVWLGITVIVSSGVYISWRERVIEISARKSRIKS